MSNKLQQKHLVCTETTNRLNKVTNDEKIRTNFKTKSEIMKVF